MVRVMLVDAYKASNARIAKDTAGGYGTENLFGFGPVAYLAEKAVKNAAFWSSLAFVQLYTELKQLPGTITSFEYREGGDLSSPFEERDIFFICNSIVCFETEVECAKRIKEQHPQALVILTGTPAMHLMEEVPENIKVLAGNYDFLLQELNVVDGENLRESLELRFADTQIVNVSSGDPNSLGTIDWSEEIWSSSKNLLVSKGKSIPYLVSRGCPYSCAEYCTYPASQGKKVIAEEVETTVKRLRQISEQLPGVHIIFRDPVFSINLKRTKELLRALAEADLGLSYTAEIHLKNVDEEFAILAQKAGFRWLKFGIESAHDSVRKDVKRHSETNDVQFEKIEMLKQHNILTNGMFILCLPSDTVRSVYQTIRYAMRLGLDFAQFSIFTPYPGTPFFEFARDSVVEKRYEKFSQFELIYQHNSISRVRAAWLLQVAYITFFAPKVIKRPFVRLKRLFLGRGRATA